MRKILSEEEKAKIIKRNQLIMGALLIGVMIFSTLGYAFSNASRDTNNTSSVTIGDRVYTKENEYWRFTVDGKEFLTRYNPDEVKSIPFSSLLTAGDYKDKPLYFVGEVGEHTIELEQNLGGGFVQRMSNACVAGENCTNDAPVKDCAHDNIIIYKKAEEGKEKIYQEDKCTYLLSRRDHQAEYADVFLFKLLDVR